MIGLAQVVAAMAGGALLMLAAWLLCQLHGHWQKEDMGDREARIEAARHAAVAALQQADRHKPLNGSEAESVDPVRRKDHLRLYIFGGVLGILAGPVRFLHEVWLGHRRQLIADAAAATAAAAAVTLLIVAPWDTGGHEEPPSLAPPASPSPSQAASSTSRPQPSGRMSPTPTGSPSTPGQSAPPASDSEPPAIPGPTATPTPTAQEPPVAEAAEPGPSGTASAPPGRGRGTGEAAPPGLTNDGDEDDEDQEPGGLACAGASADPVLEADACLLISG